MKETSIEEMKAAVLKAWPDAFTAQIVNAPLWMIQLTSRQPLGPGISGWHESEELAWSDAYAKLPQPQPAQVQERCPQCYGDRDNPGEDPIERLIVCGASFHRAKPSPKPQVPAAMFCPQMPAPEEPAKDERGELPERLASAFAEELLGRAGIGVKCYPPPSEEGTSPTRNVHALWRAALKVMDALEAELAALRAKPEQPRNTATTAFDGSDLEDSYLDALLRYSAGFYGAAVDHGMSAKDTTHAMQHIEQAARGLHKVCKSLRPECELTAAKAENAKQAEQIREAWKLLEQAWAPYPAGMEWCAFGDDEWKTVKEAWLTRNALPDTGAEG